MYSIRPEPDPAERAALERALEPLLRGDEEPLPYQSAWRQAAFEEATAGEEDDEARLVGV